MKLLVKEKKGSSFRLINLETKQELRAFSKDFKDIDFLVGSLLEVSDLKVSSDLVEKMTVVSEILGDSSKARVEVDTASVKIGDLIDGIPVLNLGQSYAKAGKKMAYAYFR